MSFITANDGTEIHYKDWGTGQPIVFSHGLPLNGDAFEDQMLFLASRGFRCIAHDRRGHGRSGETWEGNDLDTTEVISLDCVVFMGLPHEEMVEATEHWLNSGWRA